MKNRLKTFFLPQNEIKSHLLGVVYQETFARTFSIKTKQRFGSIYEKGLTLLIVMGINILKAIASVFSIYYKPIIDQSRSQKITQPPDEVSRDRISPDETWAHANRQILLVVCFY